MKSIVFILFCTVSVTFSSCKKEEEERYFYIKEKVITLKYNSEEQILVMQNDTSALPTFECSDPEVAIVSADGTVTGKLNGTASIYVRSQDGMFTDTCTVNVFPTAFYFREPLLKFGCTKKAVKDYEIRRFYKDVSSILVFYPDHATLRYVAYAFDGEQMVQPAMFLVNATWGLYNAMTLLKERYNYMGYRDDCHVYYRGKIGVVIRNDRGLGQYMLYFTWNPTDITHSGSVLDEAKKAIARYRQLDKFRLGANSPLVTQ